MGYGGSLVLGFVRKKEIFLGFFRVYLIYEEMGLVN